MPFSEEALLLEAGWTSSTTIEGFWDLDETGGSN
jgi:hypothetical protein